MNITELTKHVGAHRKRRRVGRGESSGHGKTSGRGHKGAGARSGYRRTVLAEGGMFPLFRRIPKFGFNNALFRTRYQIVNIADLDRRFDSGSHVTVNSLMEAGLINNRNHLVKLLGNGELSKPLTIEAHRFSASAVRKIEKAGGEVKWLHPKPKKKFIKRPKSEIGPEKKSKQGSTTKKPGKKMDGSKAKKKD